MMNFQFEAFGQKLTFEANDVTTAYVRANRFFQQLIERGEIELPIGAWMDEPAGPGVLGYRWIEGNFFD